MTTINNKKIIKYDESFRFAFVENTEDRSLHPASDYYLKPSDFSINVLISLKWVLWGFTFFKHLSNELLKLEEDYKFENLLDGCIQDKNLLDFKEMKHALDIDGKNIENDEEFYELMNGLYNENFFDENTKIHLKLKINLREFLIISNFLFPTLIKFKFLKL